MSAPVPNPGILDIHAYVGGEAHAPGASRLIRLASNEGALGPSPKAIAAYTAVAGQMHRYPDGGSKALRAGLGRRFGLDAERIVCGNGSDDVLQLLTRAYAGVGDEVLHTVHGFAIYPISARFAGATPVAAPERDLKTDVDALLARVTPHTRVVFIANPNNPTGSYLNKDELRRLHAGLPENVLLVIDAAYAEYVDAPDYTDGADLVDEFSNVVMTRTFSKIFALGGLRLGWAYCPAAVADVLNRVRGPFNVASSAQAAGLAALEDVEFLERSRRHNTQVRGWFVDQVRALGLVVHPSVANFVLISFAEQAGDRADAEGARQLLKSRGILVRQVGSYGLPHCLRVTIGLEDEMRAVVDGLADWVNGK
ncbi:histidinol-phosphate transaminase [Nitrospirillum sp. BR 11752]|uniref:histidinol-phosphate transaminase n=1 Tax=Nitrospirillum sp. BR 11752 TaxID=3104293 RepID=UPI002EB6B911|nr:histidinol-phosphate transaminase [Nitrospirillum sp. BR 11752]